MGAMNYRWMAAFICMAFLSCSRPSVIPTPRPVPTFPSPEPAPAPSTSSPHTWHLIVDRLPHSYQSQTKNTVKNDDQPTTNERVTQGSVWFSISINSLLAPTVFSGMIDSVRLMPEVNGLHFPATFTGSVSEHQLIMILSSQTPEQRCFSPIESLFGDIRQAISSIPSDLTTGATWTDSLTTVACSGDRLPTTVHTTRQYVLEGLTNFAGRETLLIKRSEKSHLTGDGTQGQHQLHLDGEGNGTATIFVDATSGILIKLEANQQTRVAINASGRAQLFTQTTHQLVTLSH